MESHTATLGHCKRVHIMVLVVHKRGTGFCAHLLAANPIHTFSNVVNSRPAMSLANYSLTSHSPYRWKPESAALTTPLLMESEDSVLRIPVCPALQLVGTTESDKQGDGLGEENEDLTQLGHTGHVFKEEFLTTDGEMLANMKIHAYTMGPRCM